MEILQLVEPIEAPKLNQSTERPFISSNTIGTDLYDIKDNHIIPVFVKDNEPLISQADFISLTMDIVQHTFQRESILNPSIRVSHPIKGRIPEAKDKPAVQLTEKEKTIYYERMAFVIEIPSISETIGGNKLSLTIGGVKSYNLDNLYSKKGGDEHFKIFIGFQNKVCMNLCVWSDGYVGDLRVKNANQLLDGIYKIIDNYNAKLHLENLQRLTQYEITETQFAQIIGRCRMYQYISPDLKSEIQELSFGDTQIGLIVKDYYKDHSFCREHDGSINLWRLYNLFTGANKSSYIDTFLDRGINAFEFTRSIANAIAFKKNSWYLGN